MTVTGTSKLAGKSALVTGGGSGIGRAICRAFALEGATVLITDIDLEKAEATSREIHDEFSVKAECIRMDVTSEADWNNAISVITSLSQKLDILVNNAGISRTGPIREFSLEEWNTVIQVNLTSVFLGIKAVSDLMKDHGGSIINMASASGIKAIPNASAYGSGKAAVRMLTKIAALEMAEINPNIRVNSVSPGGVKTPLWKDNPFWDPLVKKAGSEEAGFQMLAQDTPQKRFADPEEIAEMVVFLASDESRFMTGSDLVTDGGYSI